MKTNPGDIDTSPGAAPEFLTKTSGFLSKRWCVWILGALNEDSGRCPGSQGACQKVRRVRSGTRHLSGREPLFATTKRQNAAIYRPFVSHMVAAASPLCRMAATAASLSHGGHCRHFSVAYGGLCRPGQRPDFFQSATSQKQTTNFYLCSTDLLLILLIFSLQLAYK